MVAVGVGVSVGVFVAEFVGVFVGVGAKLTTVVSVAWLFVGFGSVSFAVVVAVFDSVVPAAACVGIIFIVNTASAPLGMIPPVQLMVPLLPTVGVVHWKPCWVNVPVPTKRSLRVVSITGG